MFENKVIDGYTYATRFIMSWVRSGGKFDKCGKGYGDFRKWLESLKLDPEDIKDIIYSSIRIRLFSLIHRQIRVLSER